MGVSAEASCKAASRFAATHNGKGSVSLCAFVNFPYSPSTHCLRFQIAEHVLPAHHPGFQLSGGQIRSSHHGLSWRIRHQRSVSCLLTRRPLSLPRSSPVSGSLLSGTRSLLHDGRLTPSDGINTLELETGVVDPGLPSC